MPVAIAMSTAGGDEIAGAFTMMNRITDDWSRAWPAVATRLRMQTRRHFNSEGGSGRAGRWTPLSARYKAWKDRYYPGRKILELTGRLRDSITNESHPDAIEVRNPRYLFVGSSVPYAGYHQDGAGTLPRRPPLSPTDRDVYEWVAEMKRYFDNSLSTVVGRSTGRLSTAFR